MSDPRLAQIEAVTIKFLITQIRGAFDHMDRAGGDAAGMPECPWCFAQTETNGDASDPSCHLGDCELIAARQMVDQLEQEIGHVLDALADAHKERDARPRLRTFNRPMDDILRAVERVEGTYNGESQYRGCNPRVAFNDLAVLIRAHFYEIEQLKSALARPEASEIVIVSQRDKALEAIRAFLAKWPSVAERVDGIIALQYTRTGRQYDGPTIHEEVAGLRRALEDKGKPIASGGLGSAEIDGEEVSG